jgi:aminopeptidase YwaD
MIMCKPLLAQDKGYVKKVIDTLCSSSMHGRGYVNNGDRIASAFISNEFRKDSLKFFTKDYLQTFNLPVGTLPGKVIVALDENKMKPGVDYLVAASCPTMKGSYSIVRIDSQTVCNKKNFKKFLKSKYPDSFILLDKKGISDKKILATLHDIKENNSLGAKGIISISDKLVWGAEDALHPATFAEINIKRSSLPANLITIAVDIEQDFQKAHEFANVIGYIKGSIIPDSFIVFTAHYDHLGQMGKDTYFPGANDNASGTAMILDLAKYYAKNKPEYSIAFIACTGEELGLVGSQYYTLHPLFPLSKIRFLVNLDLEGTGDDGIKVVNGAVITKEFNLLAKLNDEKKYLPSVNKRGEAAISDHYFFYKKGVKAFYIYTLGGITEYHNIYDKAATLPLTKYNELFKLLVEFVKELKE